MNYERGTMNPCPPPHSTGRMTRMTNDTMTNDEKITALARPNIRALQPYTSARDEAPKWTGNTAPIFLDANENSMGSPLDEDFSRYPDPQQSRLKQALARLHGLSAEQIFVGNGSDEAIDLLIRVFVEPGRDNVVLLPPTYGMYAVQANIHGVEIRQAGLRPDFSPDAAAVRAVTDAGSKLLFICSPNNPTGQCLPDDFVLEMLRDFPGLVVVDEAYADFSTKPTWTARLADFPNLVVLRTLSKAWGLAGLRVGMALGNPLVINFLNKIKYPYNLNSATLRLAETALRRTAEMRRNMEVLLAERSRLEAALPLLGCVLAVFPSDANFLLVQVDNADGLYRYLCENGAVVRNRSREPHCENCLRITVGKPEENGRLLELLAAFGG